MARKPRAKPSQTNIIVRAPLSHTKLAHTGQASVQSHANGLTVTFRELIHSGLLPASSGSGFILAKTFYVNPGLVDTFPWLSSLARNYDQYEVKFMNFQYVNAVPATRQGFVYMVPDYDVYDGVPTTPASAMNQLGASSGPVWNGLNCSIKRQAAMALGPRRYVRIAGSARDKNVTDVAKMHVFVSDNDSASPMPGQIWVSYSINLYAPQTVPPITVPTDSAFTNESAEQNVDFGSDGDAQTVIQGGITPANNGLGITSTITQAGEGIFEFARPQVVSILENATCLLETTTDDPTVFHPILQYSTDGVSFTTVASEDDFPTVLANQGSGAVAFTYRALAYFDPRKYIAAAVTKYFLRIVFSALSTSLAVTASGLRTRTRFMLN